MPSSCALRNGHYPIDAPAFSLGCGSLTRLGACHMPPPPCVDLAHSLCVRCVSPCARYLAVVTNAAIIALATDSLATLVPSTTAAAALAARGGFAGAIGAPLLQFGEPLLAVLRASLVARLALLVAAEHAVIGVKAMLSAAIPDEPVSVRLQKHILQEAHLEQVEAATDEAERRESGELEQRQ